MQSLLGYRRRCRCDANFMRCEWVFSGLIRYARSADRYSKQLHRDCLELARIVSFRWSPKVSGARTSKPTKTIYFILFSTSIPLSLTFYVIFMCFSCRTRKSILATVCVLWHIRLKMLFKIVAVSHTYTIRIYLQIFAQTFVILSAV